MRSEVIVCRFVWSLAVFLAGCALVGAATLPTGFSESPVATGLSNPTAMAFAPDGRLFVCEQGGQLRVIKNGALLPTPFLTATVNAFGERGLLGVTFDPNFATNQFVYVYYTATTPAIHNRVSRFTANGDVALAGSEVIILDLNNLSGATNHNGGAIHFGPDGKLYIAVGENATPSNSQTLSNLLGKILRINADGSIPSDNPFFNTATGTNRAIWALGLRNPYTFAFQAGTGRMFINDVGQNAWEEINVGQSGANYGWPTCEGSCGAGFVNPLFAYPHNGGNTTGCAITGGAFYNPTSNQFPANYSGTFFFADFCSGWIKRIDPITAALADFATRLASPVDLQVHADGSLYYLERGGGRVVRIRFTGTEVQFNSANYGISEGQPNVSITVVRTGDLSGAASVDYATANGTADEKSDYTTALGSLSFAAGETSKTFLILLTDDLYVEGNETVNLVLSNATGAAVGTQGGAVLTISDNDVGQPTTNPADQPNFFVRLQYLDFLNREPDAGGFAYWTNEISSCGNDQLCIHNRRIGVSAAFFIEQEFQNTGFFVYRFYKATLERRLTFIEFMRDRTRLQAGGDLATAKTSYANEFVQRTDFVVKYPLAQTGMQFVDALILAVRNSSGLDLGGKSSELLAEYNLGGSQSERRARVVVKLIEYAEYQEVEFNPAFVLAEYFGYLRRNPDEGGYQFWLDVLNNREPNNYRGMVCSFLTSAEYQQRFSSVVTRSNRDCAP